MLHLIAFIAIGACIVSLPVCNADAYSPFSAEPAPSSQLFEKLRAGDDVISRDQACTVCSTPENQQNHQAGFLANPFAERFATFESSVRPLFDGSGDVPRSLIGMLTSFQPPPNPPRPQV